MCKIDSIDLSKQDITIIMKNLDKENFLEPLKSEKYKEYKRGFRNVNSLPEEKVAVFYYQEIFKKNNISVREKLSKVLQPTIEEFNKEINKILPNFNPKIENEPNAQEFKKLCITLTKKYSTDIIPIWFKLIGFKLNEIQSIIFEMQADKMKELINMQTRSSKNSEKEFNKKLQEEKERTKAKLESKSKLEQHKMNEDYNIETKKLKSQYENKITKFEEKIKEMRETNSNLENKQAEYAKRQEKIIEKADSKISELTILVDTLNEDVKKLKDDIVNSKNEEEVLRNKLKNFEGLLDLRYMEKPELITLVKEATSQDNEIRERFKSFFKNFNENEIDEKTDLLSEWNKWTSREATAIDNLLSKCISKGDLKRADLESLDEVTYTLQLRFLVSKLFIHLGYKYLTSEYWQELFL